MKKRLVFLNGLWAAALCVLLSGCATNPVTGRRELQLISQGEEISIGAKNYGPSQQSQGGLYTADPAVTEYVRGVGRKLAEVSHRPTLPFEFVVLNNNVPNAWAMPGGKIAINRGLLLEINTEAELAAVLGHEIVHSTARHGAKAMERGILLNTGLMGVELAAKNHKDGPWAVQAVSAASELTMLKYSRSQESEADEFGVGYMQRAGYDVADAVTLQEEFVRLQKGRRSGVFETLFSTHPPSEERVKALRELTDKLPKGGFVGRDEYRQHIKHLTETKVAYEAYESGRRALVQGNPRNALNAADEALKGEPREALFLGLRGDALDALSQRDEALRAYDAAIGLNEGYFYPHLRRGQILQQLGRADAAKVSLQRSLELLPTADAHYAVGLMERRAGREQQALEHWQAASLADNDAGKQSRILVARATLPAHPENFLRTSAVVDREGNVLIRVQNASPVDVAGLVIQVDLATPTEKQSDRLERADALPAGHIVDLPTRLNPVSAAELKKTAVTIRILSAAVR